MKLTKVLSAFSTEKTATAGASPAPAEKTAAASDTTARLVAALKEASAPPTEKVAAAQASPVADLVKIAGDVAGAEHEALVKEAQLYGASVCDGFMARMSQYNEAAEKIAGQQLTKTAAVAAPAATDASFEKFAAENPQLVKEAAELGYSTTMGQLEKLADVAFKKGYDQAVESIYKTAHASFCAGFEDTLRLVSEIRQ